MGLLRFYGRWGDEISKPLAKLRRDNSTGEGWARGSGTAYLVLALGRFGNSTAHYLGGFDVELLNRKH